MSKLLEQIDNVLFTLKEDLNDKKFIPLINAAKLIDPRISNEINWGKLDNSWNKLVDTLSNPSINVVKAKNAKYIDNGRERNDLVPDKKTYIKWDLNNKTAELTTIDQATPIDKSQNNLLTDISEWLKNDLKSKEIVYDELIMVTDKARKQAALSILLAYYFEKQTGKDYDSTVPDYWKSAILNDVKSNTEITSSKVMWFVITANNENLRDLNILSILRDEKISRIIFTLLDENKINASMLPRIEKEYFILNAILSGCYEDLSYQEAIQSFTTYTNISRQYLNNDHFLKPNVSRYLAGDDEDDKAITLAENSILCLKYADVESNQLYIAAQKNPDEYDENFKINKLPTDNRLSGYRALHSAEIKSLLQEIISEEAKNETVQYWISIGNNNYVLMPTKDNKLVTLDEKDGVIFTSGEVVKVCHCTKGLISESKNLFTPTDITSALETSINDFSLTDSFEIDEKEGLKVKGNDFKLKGKSVVSFQVDTKSNTIVKLKLSGSISFISEAEAKRGNSKATTSNGLDARLDKADAVEAISKYLKENKPQSLETDDKVDLFMNTRNKEPKFDMYRDSTIRELMSAPDLYLYDSTNKVIKNIKNTMLEVLIDLLNGDLDKAKDALDSHALSPFINVNYRSLPAKEWSSKTVAQKLSDLANILNQDQINAANKIDKRVKDQLDKQELADLVAWFNSRFIKGRTAKAAHDATETNNEE